MAPVSRIVMAFALLMPTLPAGAKAPPLPGPDKVLHFAGTEPFWGGTVRRGRMVYTSPANERGEHIRVRRTDTPDRIQMRGRMAQDGAFTMTVVAKPCSDGMSDNSYPYDVRIAFRTSRILGCGWTAHHPYKRGE